MTESVSAQHINELVDAYRDQTLICSTANHMERMPAYAELRAVGEAAVPMLLQRLQAGEGGMAYMLMLATITGQSPAESAAEPVAPGWVGIHVEDAMRLWVDWGIAKGLL